MAIAEEMGVALQSTATSINIKERLDFSCAIFDRAGSLIATNYLYSKAAQDGTVLGSVSRNIPNYAFMKQANANFDPLKFNWIGSPEMTHRACYARADSGVTRPEHLYERELRLDLPAGGPLRPGPPVRCFPLLEN